MKTLAFLTVLVVMTVQASADPLVSFTTSGAGANRTVVMEIDPNDLTNGYNAVQVDINVTGGPLASATFSALITTGTGSGGLGGTEIGQTVDGTNADGIWASLGVGNTDISSAVLDWLTMNAPAGAQIAYTIDFANNGPTVATVSGNYVVPAAAVQTKVPAVLPIGLLALCSGLGIAGVRVLSKKR